MSTKNQRHIHKLNYVFATYSFVLEWLCKSGMLYHNFDGWGWFCFVVSGICNYGPDTKCFAFASNPRVYLQFDGEGRVCTYIVLNRLLYFIRYTIVSSKQVLVRVCIKKHCAFVLVPLTIVMVMFGTSTDQYTQSSPFSAHFYHAGIAPGPD